MPLSEDQWTSLASRLTEATRHVAPDWTDANAHDPGITLLELMSFLLDALQVSGATRDERTRAVAHRVAQRAMALAAATAPETDQGPGLVRVNFLHGMLLGAEDFRTEQEYTRGRLNRRNRTLHGSGIVDGLEVSVEGDSSDPRVSISPGLAFAPDGNEISVEAALVLTLPVPGGPLFVLLAYAEQPARRAPTTLPDPVDTGDPEPTRIVETVHVTLAPAPAADAVPIARLQQVNGAWCVDAGFTPSRIRS